ncbi:MAG: dCTP deaminase domain-containing protein [Parasphingorhabdus sp.]
MTFWSTATIRKRVFNEKLISDYHEDRVNRASYTLRMGSQAYVSPEMRATAATGRPITTLDKCTNCTIPPGQFGFLLTEETIRVPDNAIAFISVRARFKFMGLVNVSGFHVDPGWNDKLIFAVFNGGPSPVTVSRGQELFHIWFADLDTEAGEVKPTTLKEAGIGSDVINGLGDQLVSMVSLENRVKEMEAAQSKIMSSKQILIALGITFSAAAVTIAVNLFMSTGATPAVLLDQRSELSIVDDKAVPDSDLMQEGILPDGQSKQAPE